MCGISGIVSARAPGEDLDVVTALRVMNTLQAHRGPDNEGIWVSADGRIGFGHRRLTIIDLSVTGNQPMVGENGVALTYNGEIYNYRELRDELRGHWTFRTMSDTETILAAYSRYGAGFVNHLRGMFAFALWDPARNLLLCARDRFGIKPLYYVQVGERLFFASEIKALLPFLPDISTSAAGLAEYLTFHYTIGETTLFDGVRQVAPAHTLMLRDGKVELQRYWDVHYEIDLDHSPRYFQRQVRDLLDDSVNVHLRSDVEIGSYVSGGIDSSLIAILASRHDERNRQAFHGKFTSHPGYDESTYASAATAHSGKELNEVDITSDDFLEHFPTLIYHLDHPVAGPGAFPQYMTSLLAAQKVKVVLGGQGGDEIFGGYARYLIAYFEQCIKAAIDGSHRSGNFVVTPQSIIDNLGVLREYKPLLKSFWQEGLFESLDRRYFRLVDRSVDLGDEIDWSTLDKDHAFESFCAVFNSQRNVRHEAYFDSMTHYDFKCLLPALLQVEDRMSMAHGLESRVPLLDHPLIEFCATVPADVKFRDGQMKHLLKLAFADVIPPAILGRRDKMGFPVPLKEWATGPLREYISDTFSTAAANSRPFFNAGAIKAHIDGGSQYSRKLWGLLSLEVWHSTFHDRAAEFRRMLRAPAMHDAPMERGAAAP